MLLYSHLNQLNKVAILLTLFWHFYTSSFLYTVCFPWLGAIALVPTSEFIVISEEFILSKFMVIAKHKIRLWYIVVNIQKLAMKGSNLELHTLMLLRDRYLPSGVNFIIVKFCCWVMTPFSTFLYLISLWCTHTREIWRSCSY